MTAASGIPQLIDQLVVIANAAFPDATSLVDVNDGPAFNQEDTGQTLWIGSDGSEESTEAARGEQSWGPMSPQHKRDDEITVHCVASAWSGDDDFKTVRDQAFAQMQAFTAACIADPSLSASCLYVRSPGSNVTLSQGFNSLGGAEARVAFDITARTRLT